MFLSYFYNYIFGVGVLQSVSIQMWCHFILIWQLNTAAYYPFPGVNDVRCFTEAVQVSGVWSLFSFSLLPCQYLKSKDESGCDDGNIQ